MTRNFETIGINGRKTPLWNKPGNFTNSELTISPDSSGKGKVTAGVSPESILGTSRGRRHARRPLLSSTSVNLADSGVEFQDSDSDDSKDAMLQKSVTFTKVPLRADHHSAAIESSSQQLLGRSFSEEIVSHGFDTGMGSSKECVKPPDDTNWFTHASHHLTSTPVRLPMPTRCVSPPPGALGAALAVKKMQKYENYRTQSAIDSLAREYFPLTLSAVSTTRAIDTPMPATLSVSPPARGLPQPNSTPWKPNPRKYKSPTAKRQTTAQGSSKSASSGPLAKSIDKLYLMATEAPTTASSGVLLSTPYQFDLAQLRMERLRLEEEHLLEVKRQEELERIRGPQPKWYEMKTPEFHYEAHKNNQLLHNENHWQSLMDYRTELTRASKNFQKTYQHI